MKLIKLALISIIVFSALLVAITITMPSRVRISRAVVINAPADSVWGLIARPENWVRWNDYVKLLTDRKAGPETIESRELNISITGRSDTAIHTLWVQASGKTFPGVFNIIRQENGLTVQWYFDFRVKWYPWEKLGSIIYDKRIGPAMQSSLAALKELAETK
jgi:hypothetical protein